MKKTNKGISAIIIVQSLLVGFFADIRCVNWALSHGGFTGAGIMNTLYPIIMIAILVVLLVYNRWKLSVGSGYAIFLTIILFLYYEITVHYIGQPYTPIFLFCGLTLFAFMLPNISVVDVRLMLKAMMLYPVFAVTRVDLVFATVTEWQNFTYMDASYGFLIPVVANVVYVLFYFRTEDIKQKVVTIAVTVVNAVYLVYLLIYASRGAILCIFLLFAFCWMAKIREDGGVRWVKSRVIISALVSLLLLLFSKMLFSYLDDLVVRLFGVHFYVFEKMVDMYYMGDVSNGRSGLNAISINGFLESPLWGNGIDIFNAKTNQKYPHNFILNILYDGGFLLFLLILVPVTFGIIRKLKKGSKDVLAMLMTLFFASVPGALFSQDIYQNPVLWMTFGYALTKQFVYEKKCNNIKNGSDQ